MAARPRIRRRANWPDNLHEPRPGYYTWRDPITKETHILGRMPLVQAMHEAQQANLAIEGLKPTTTLVERLTAPKDTVADLLKRMPTGNLKPATLTARKHLDKAIVEKLGQIPCAALKTKHIADFLEAVEQRGKSQWAVHLRARLKQMCRRGMALGLMENNPADATDRPRVTVRRERLSLEVFNAILEKAPEVSPWLPNAMLLALLSGQDRMTIAGWERSAQKDGYAVLTRGKTGVRIAIPLELRMDAIGLSLADVIARCKSTGVVSRYLIHHPRTIGRAKAGSPIMLQTITDSFREARILAGFTAETAPTFHEIRSLSKRLYDKQGNVDTRALLGHLSDATAALYANSRGLEPLKVRFGGGQF